MPDAPNPASTVENQPASGAWAESLDGELKPWVSGMGLDKLPADQALAKVLPMYRGAEQKLGVPADQIIRLPGKDAKPEDWRAVYSKLGAPDKPEGYEISAPEGGDPEFAKTAATWFHELGVPKSMAGALAGKWNEHVAAMQAKQEGMWNQRFDQEVAELKGEWKNDYDKNMDLSNRVLRVAGFTREQQVALEQALGPKAFRQAFAKFGGMVGEHRFVGDGSPQQFGMSPAGAKQRIEDLRKDATWMSAYLGGDAEKKAEWTRLHQVAFPEQEAA
jgi:stage V sporulation protein SpoVS